MKVNPDGQGGARHRHQGVGFVCWVEWNSSDSLVDGVEQEGAHSCSGTGQDETSNRVARTLPAY